MDKLLSVKEASVRLGLSLWTIYRWARSGRVASVQLGRRRLFSEEDLQVLVNQARSISAMGDATRTTEARTRRPNFVEAAEGTTDAAQK